MTNTGPPVAKLIPLAHDWLEKSADAAAVARNQVHESLTAVGRNIIGQNWSDDEGHHLDIIAIDYDRETVTGVIVVHADDLTDGQPLHRVVEADWIAASESLTAYLEADDPGWKPDTRIDFVSIVDRGTNGDMQIEIARGRR
jgi:Holliday junction resolvase-like predicted endonuclease